MTGPRLVGSGRILPAVAELSQVSIDYATTGDKTLVAAVAGQTIRVYGFFLFIAVATSLQFKDGVAGAGFHGVIAAPTNFSMILDIQVIEEPWFVTTAGNAFVLNQTGTSQISGRLYYSQS